MVCIRQLLATLKELSDPAGFARMLDGDRGVCFAAALDELVEEDEPALMQLCEHDGQLLQHLAVAIKSGLQLFLKRNQPCWGNLPPMGEVYDALLMLCGTLGRCTDVWVSQSPSMATGKIAGQVAAAGLIPVFAKACPVLAAALSLQRWQPSERPSEHCTSARSLLCCCAGVMQLWVGLTCAWPQPVLLDTTMSAASLPVAGLALAALSAWPAAAAADACGAAASARAPADGSDVKTLQQSWNVSLLVAERLIDHVRGAVAVADEQQRASTLHPLLASRSMQQVMMVYIATIAQSLHDRARERAAPPNSASSSSGGVAGHRQKQLLPAYHTDLLEAILGGSGGASKFPDVPSNMAMGCGSTDDACLSITVAAVMTMMYTSHVVQLQSSSSSSSSSNSRSQYVAQQQESPLLARCVPFLLVLVQLLVLQPRLEVHKYGLAIMYQLLCLPGRGASARAALAQPVLHHLAPAVLQQLERQQEVIAPFDAVTGGAEQLRTDVQMSLNSVVQTLVLAAKERSQAGLEHTQHPGHHLVTAFAQDPIHSSMALESVVRRMPLLLLDIIATGAEVCAGGQTPKLTHNLLPSCAVSVCHAATVLSGLLAAPAPAAEGQGKQQQQQQLCPRMFALLLSSSKAFGIVSSRRSSSQTEQILSATRHALMLVQISKYMAGAPADTAAAAAGGGATSSSSSSSASRSSTPAAAAAAAANTPWLHLVARSLALAGWDMDQAPAVIHSMTGSNIAGFADDLLSLQSAAAWLCDQVQLLQAVQPAVPQQTLQQLLSQQAELQGSMEQLVSAVKGSSSSRSSCRGRAATSNAAAAMTAVATAAAQHLRRFAATASACLPTRHCCNSPGCTNMDKQSELQLVGGKSCICAGCKTARYCSKQCQTDHWQQHKPVCKRLKAQGVAQKD